MPDDQVTAELRDGMPFLGGSLWLDLLNSTPVVDGAVRDLLATGESYRAWLKAAGLAGGDTDEVARKSLVELREKLRGWLAILQAGESLPDSAVGAIDALLAGARIRLKFGKSEAGPVLGTTFEPGAAGAAAIVAENFARFAVACEPGRLKGCANPACTMVFYDRGKNNTRRWCSMALCGNRDKVARYRARARS